MTDESNAGLDPEKGTKSKFWTPKPASPLGVRLASLLPLTHTPSALDLVGAQVSMKRTNIS